MPRPKRCTICKGQTDELAHVDLEVIGSEGIWVCVLCRKLLTDVAKVLQTRYAAAFTAGWDAGRKAGDRRPG